jgi:hypothetical protein
MCRLIINSKGKGPTLGRGGPIRGIMARAMVSLDIYGNDRPECNIRRNGTTVRIVHPEDFNVNLHFFNSNHAIEFAREMVEVIEKAIREKA